MATDAWGPSGQSSLNRDDFNQILKACREQEWQEEEEKLLTATVNMQSSAPPLIYFIEQRNHLIRLLRYLHGYCDLCSVQGDLNVSSKVQEIHKKFVHLVFQFYM